MKRFEIHGGTGRCEILIGERLEKLQKYIPVETPVIITDTHVNDLYGSAFPRAHVIEIGTGETIKNMETVQQIYRQLIALETDRAAFIVGIGGGIVCDIAGFVASTYLRGVRFGFVSSTLLSQVDASVGGKNGVNFSGYKNMIGVFNQPEFVICDIGMLSTLPEKEIQCGLAEIVKHAAIANAEMFNYIEKNSKKALSGDPVVIEKLIDDSVIIKSTIVNRDEKEKGERRKLNFGHTFGHAIEKVTDVPHGQAVGLGMVIASALSVNRGLLSNQENLRLRKLLKNLHLPIRIKTDAQDIFNALGRDKKREGGRIKFVLLQRIGRAVIEEIPIEELRRTVDKTAKIIDA